MKLTRLLAILLLPFIAVLVLAGCAAPSNNNSDDKDDDKDSSEVEDEDEDEDEDDAPADDELAEPGTRVGIDEWLTHSFVSTDDVGALISSRLVSVEQVDDEQLAFLKETFDEGQLEGYDVWILQVEEKKVSGESIVFNADYTGYNAVDEDGNQVQGLSVIGWDDCESLSFDEEFDSNGATLTQCILGAAKPGDPVPAGVNYTGGYEDDNPYSDYDGKPLLFIKD